MEQVELRAVVQAVCSLHRDRGPLAAWGIDTNDALLILNAPGMDTEPVEGWRERQEPWRGLAPDGWTDQPYVKWVLHCLVPSCNYRAELGQAAQGYIADFLRGRAACGMGEPASIEVNEFLREIAGRKGV
jgi:hypothetical protein